MWLSMLLVFVTTVLFFYKWLNMRPRNFPPGPMPLPVIGSVYSLPSKHIEICIEKWSNKYGEVIGYIFGRTPTVFVTGVDNVLAALHKYEFQGRPDIPVARYRSFHKRLGLGFSDGKQWFETHRFTVKYLRGVGILETENLIKEEIDELMTSIEENSVVQANGFFSFSTLNVIWTLVSNRRFTLGDTKTQAFVDSISDFIRRGKHSGDIVTIFPILRHVSPSFQYSYRINKLMQNFMRGVIEEHRSALDYNCPRDLIDSYLTEMEERNRRGTNATYSEEDLIVLCMDLFTAGVETSTNAMEFFLLYMVLYPDVQNTLQQELDRVLLRSRRPNLDDQNNLPYMMAVITEVLRVNPVLPITLPHRCTKGTKFNNYFIPKDAIVIMSLWSLGRSKEHWKEPDKFDPTRFIDDNGQYIRYPFLRPFGSGRRSCVGEALAKNIIFLFLAIFFQKFSVSLPEGDPLPSTEGQTGFSSAAKPFRIKITNRF